MALQQSAFGVFRLSIASSRKQERNVASTKCGRDFSFKLNAIQQEGDLAKQGVAEKYHENPEERAAPSGDRGDFANSEGNEIRLQEADSQEYVTKIPVTRQKYIQVSKMALVSSLRQGFRSKEDESNFITICSCLESILHAEHKSLLEELRTDSYALSGDDVQSTSRDTDASIRNANGNGTAAPTDSSNENGAAATTSQHSDRIARFQKNILLILKRAQFQGLSARDLQLTTALNSDYLLTLPIDVDWKSTSSANVIIFRRGYSTQIQEGYLFGAKLDYIQSLILRTIFNLLAQPLLRLQQRKQEQETWTEPLRKWLEEPLSPDDANVEIATEHGDNLPMWAAARRAVPRYEAVLSSAGSRGKLLRRLLVWLRIVPPEKNTLPNLFDETPAAVKEPHLRPGYLTRVSMRDIWLPVLDCHVERNVWKKVQEAFFVFFSRSKLQEPAFKELVVLHERGNGARGDVADRLRLELNTYNDIPVPDLKIVFPNKKLTFRLLDTVRLDITTLVGLLAFLVNYRFDDFLSSPSAFILDIVTTVALVVFGTRVVLGYKQTWDRYQLLVNKILYEKTLASGFGVVHFLIDASEEQQLKEAILLYGMLLQCADNQGISLENLSSICERYIYDKFQEQIEMPIHEAVNTLSRLGLISLQQKNDVTFIRATDCDEAPRSLQKKWQMLLTSHASWYAS